MSAPSSTPTPTPTHTPTPTATQTPTSDADLAAGVADSAAAPAVTQPSTSAPGTTSPSGIASRSGNAAVSSAAAAELFLVRTDSPIGRIEVTADADAILSLNIERAGALPHDAEPQHPNALLTEAVRQLGEYFAGGRQQFDLPVRLVGTPFQQAIWHQLQRLDWGDFVSYGELGAAAGRPGSGRAVGGAVGANPVPIIVGCHRVLASNQKITGYSGGNGIPTKVWLLDHESIGHL